MSKKLIEPYILNWIYQKGTRTIAEQGKDAIVKALSDLGVEATDQLSLYDYANLIEEIYSNYPKTDAETGYELEFSDTLENARIESTILGNTVQDGTPAPDDPVDIQVVTGENTIKVSNKNLFDTTVVQGAVDNNTVASSTTRLRTSDFIRVQPSTTYMCSFSGNARDYDVHCFTTNSFPRASELGWKTDTSFTTPSNCNYIMITFRKSDNSTISTSDIDNIQLEKGNVATDYIQHQEQSFPISLGSLELCKNGDYQDYIYYDNGKWYKYGAIGKYNFSENSNTWSKTGTSVDRYYLRFASIVDFNIDAYSNVLCNYFSWKANAEEIGKFTTNNQGYIGFAMFDKNTSTIEDWLSWLSTHNTIVYYVLAEATETEITNQALINQLEALYNAKSYDDSTIITVSSDSDNAQMLLTAKCLLKG